MQFWLLPKKDIKICAYLLYNLHVFQCDIPKPIHTFIKYSSEWLPEITYLKGTFLYWSRQPQLGQSELYLSSFNQIVPHISGDGLIHIEFKSGGHNYFGSVAALFDTYAPETLGISGQCLYDCKVTPDRPYRDKTCTIRKRSIKKKRGNRAASKS